MSGYKYSEVDFRKETEEMLTLLRQIREARARLHGLAGSQILNRAPEGIKDAFSDEVDQAARWSRDVQQEEGRVADLFGQIQHIQQGSSLMGDYAFWSPLSFASPMSNTELRDMLNRLNGLVDSGHQVLNVLLSSFTRRADAVQQAHSLRLLQLEAKYAEHRDLILNCFGPETVRDLDASLRDIAYALGDSQIREAGSRLEETERAIDLRISEAEDLTEKQQRRLFVLKALRQVSVELGFEETQPRYRHENDSTSDIIYEVDTFDQGRLSFTLSLDKIQSHSVIEEERCLEEYGVISESLEREFGVKTKFRMEEETPDQKLLQKEEIELPADTLMESEA